MKAVHIEFVRDRRWRWVWVAALTFSLVVATVFAWHYQALRQKSVELSEQTQALRLQLQKLRAPVIIKADPRSSSLAQAAFLLRLDMNRVFATPENLVVEGVKLRSLAFESTSGTMKLEYELESLDRAAAITEELNAGNDRRPWRLESVSASTSNQTTGITAGVLSANLFRGVWSAQVNSL